MVKNYTSYVIGLLMLLLLITACSTADESQENENNETTKTADAKELNLPEADLQKMDEGTAVQALQEVLNEVGYSITVDGDFDDATTWAVTDFQLQHDDLLAIGVYNMETKETLEEMLSTGETVESEAGLPLDADETSTSHEDTHVLANPYDQLALVNKQYALPSDYTPDDLEVPDVPFPFDEDLPQKQLRAVAADALEELFQAADEAGLDLVAQSGYRSYDRQDAIFASNVEAHGEEEANNFSAQPGESEHQTGLTMDVTTPSIDNELTTDFSETEEGKWVEEHAAEYGFIIRYPEGKEEITEYQFEPWHIRYVGEKTAQEITDQAITLEEYYGVE